MESGFSSNLTFLIAPMEAVLFPSIEDKITMTAEIVPIEELVVAIAIYHHHLLFIASLDS